LDAWSGLINSITGMLGGAAMLVLAVVRLVTLLSKRSTRRERLAALRMQDDDGERELDG
jgi:hypothetical protein